MNPTWLDNAISWLFPEAGARRMRARVLAHDVAAAIRSGYDGAAKTDRTKNWKARSTSQNSENRGALVTLRNRARDLERNEGWVVGALDSMVNNTIGAGIIAHAVAKTEGRAKNFDMAWTDWAESLDCDADGRNNIYGLQALVFRMMKRDGEVIIRKVKRSSSFRLTVPFQLQVLEADYIDTAKEDYATKDGNFIVQGVEFDKYGRRVAYWLFQNHPGDAGLMSGNNLQSVRVPADEVLHVFETARAGQVRGVSAFAPVLIKLRDLADFSDAALMRQKVAMCFTAFVTEAESLDPTRQKDLPPLGEKLGPAGIEILAPTQSVEFANPPAPPEFGGFSGAQLRNIARGIGMSYEALTGDYSQVNYSSGKMGRQEYLINIERWRWHLVIPHFCVPVWRWFTDAAAVMGMGSDPVVSRWTPPAHVMIDVVKETDALLTQVRAGFKSQQTAIRELGYEPKEVVKEISEWNKLLDKNEIVLDSDPRQDQKQEAEQSQADQVEDDSEQKV